jgi:hypothetical protein
VLATFEVPATFEELVTFEEELVTFEVLATRLVTLGNFKVLRDSKLACPLEIFDKILSFSSTYRGLQATLHDPRLSEYHD